tara:strand:- start:1971 stop:3290 length:1320 start_codon:yes stop_codon:yes gene_type:complete
MIESIKEEYKEKEPYLNKLLEEDNYIKLREELSALLKKDPNHRQCLLRLAIAYRMLKNYSLSESIYSRIIQLDPKDPYGYCVYAELLFHVGMIERSVRQYDKALDVKNNYFFASFGKAHSLVKMDDNKGAIECFKKALKDWPNHPNYRVVKKGLAHAYMRIKMYKEASDILHGIISKKYKDSQENTHNYLECLYFLGDEVSFYKALDEDISLKGKSADIASISSHAAVRFDREDKYPFCNKPLEYFYQKNLLTNNTLTKEDLNNFVREGEIDSVVPRRQMLLENGKQTSGDIFSKGAVNKSQNFQNFLKIINNEIKNYKTSFSGDCDLISCFPEDYSVKGWLIQINSNGYLKPHIHKMGWISGSIYLDMPEKRKGNEGNIKFSTAGNEYPNNGKLFPEKIVNLSIGDIILFPSSLFHSTIPYESSERRITLAFDVIPNK